MLRWNLNGVPDSREYFQIKYIKNNHEVTISSLHIRSHNEILMWNYNSNNNPFERNRISGSLNLVNGYGTATFELKNIQYNEDGDFTLEMFKIEKLSVNVKVQGKIELPYYIRRSFF